MTITIRKRLAAVPVLAAVCVLGAMAVVQSATATHVRPKAATPMYLPLMPTQKRCLAPNREHNPANLPALSCNPPAQTSSFLTVGTPDANVAAANSTGFLKLVSTAAPDMAITSSITDVRCKPATSAGVCGTANAVGGPDYSGQVQIQLTMELTDHNNGPAGGPYTQAGTTEPLTLAFPMPCTSSVSTAIGATCDIATTMNTLTGGVIAAGKRLGVVVDDPNMGGAVCGVVVDDPHMGGAICDSGADGVAATHGDETLFMGAGLFFP